MGSGDCGVARLTEYGGAAPHISKALQKQEEAFSHRRASCRGPLKPEEQTGAENVPRLRPGRNKVVPVRIKVEARNTGRSQGRPGRYQ